GFLPTLGPRFLSRLYRRIARSERACAFVVSDGDRVLAFAAGTQNVSEFYREFLVRDGAVSALLAAPKAFRAWRPALETLRYPARRDTPRGAQRAVAAHRRPSGRTQGARPAGALSRRGCGLRRRRPRRGDRASSVAPAVGMCTRTRRRRRRASRQCARPIGVR